MLTSSAAVAATAWVAPVVVGFDRVAAATPSDTSCEVPVVSNGAAWLAAPPPTLAVGGPLESDVNTFVFSETPAPVTLAADLLVDRTTAGSFNGNSNQNATVAAGTTICSYFVHGDKDTLPGLLFGQLMFATSTIVGLIYENATFSASSFLEAPATAYVYGGMESTDDMGLDLTPGANTLRWSMLFGGHVDQIRVITAC